jgi:hypothetical protein
MDEAPRTAVVGANVALSGDWRLDVARAFCAERAHDRDLFVVKGSFLDDGVGDLDLSAPRPRWVDLHNDLLACAGDRTAGYAVACRHYPSVQLNFLVSTVDEQSQALEVDLADGLWHRARPLLPHSYFSDLCEDDGGGCRRLHKGAAAAWRFVTDSLSHRDEGGSSPPGEGSPQFYAVLRDVIVSAGRSSYSRKLGGRDPFVAAIHAAYLTVVRRARRHWRGLPRTVPDVTAWLAVVRAGGHTAIPFGGQRLPGTR